MEVPCVLTPASAARTYWLNMDRPSGRPWNNQRIPLWVAKSFLSQISHWASNAIVPFLVRAWPAICQVMGSSPSPPQVTVTFFSLFLSLYFFLSQWLWLGVRSVRCGACLKSEPLRCASCSPHPPHRTCQHGIHFSWIPGSNRYKSSKRKYCSLLRQ